MTRVYKKHPVEFKNRAVNMVLVQKKPRAQVARSLDISCSTLDQWITKFERDGTVGDARHRRRKPSSPDSDRLKQLEKELEEVKMERDILKKAAAYFAKESI